MPNNPPANPIVGAIYVDQVTNLSWVWTGTFWIQAGTSTGYNAGVGPGTTLVPGYYSEPRPESWLPIISSTQPQVLECGQIWVDTSQVPYASYVWDCNLGQFISLGAGPGSDTNSIVSTAPPTLRVNGGSLEVGDLWINPSTKLASYRTSSNSWEPFSAPDTHSIYGSVAPSVRNDGTPMQEGDLWVDIDNNVIHYLKSGQFVPITAQSENVLYGPTAPIQRANTDPLVAGDIWTNTTDEYLYYWDGVSWIPHGYGHSFYNTGVPATRITGEGFKDGDQWYDPSDKKLYVYDSSIPNWIHVNEDTHSFTGNGDPIVSNPQLTRPDGTALLNGDQYIDELNGNLYAYVGGGWVSFISSDTHAFTSTGVPTLTVRPTDGSALLDGDIYIDKATNIAYYYDNTDGWEEFSKDTHSFLGVVDPTGAVNVRPGPQGFPLIEGDMWINQTANTTYYWNGTNWRQFGGDTHSIRDTTLPIARPDGSALKDGDLHVDTDNGNALYVYNIGTPGWEPVAGDRHSFFGLVAPTLLVRPTDGSPLLDGDQYFNGTTNTLYVYNQGSWVASGPNTHSIRDTTFPLNRPDGSSLQDGDMYVDTDNGNVLYVYNLAGNSWDIAGPDTHSFTGATAPVDNVNRPNGTPLQSGDQWLNTTTNILYAWDSGTWRVVSNDTHSFFSAVDPAYNTRPDNSGPVISGDQHLNTASGVLWVYNGTAWVVASQDTNSILDTFADPNGNVLTKKNGTNLVDGDRYINTSTGEEWYYNAGTATWVLFNLDLHSFSGNGLPTAVIGTGNRPGSTIPFQVGDQYVNLLSDELYYWNGGIWEILSTDTHSFEGAGLPGTIIGTTNRPGTTTNLVVGDQYIDTDTEYLYHWDGGTWELLTQDLHSFQGVAAPALLQRPNTAPLQVGDQFVNTTTKTLYYWDGAAWEQFSGDTHSFSGAASPVGTVTVRPGTGHALETGDQYFETTNKLLYSWDGANWVIVSPYIHSFVGTGEPGTVLGTVNRPDSTPLQAGDQYVDDSTNLLWSFIGGAWIVVSGDTHAFTAGVSPTTAGSGVDAGNRPDGTALVDGDLYVDQSNQVLYTWYGAAWNRVSKDTHAFTGAVDPTDVGSLVDTGTRPDGTTPLQAGDIYFNTISNVIYYYNGGAWSPLAAPADTHSFSGAGDPVVGNPQLTRPNGDLLLNGDQYLDTNTNILYIYNGGWVSIGGDTQGIVNAGVPTPATTRNDGSGLTLGDTYYDSASGISYFWDGAAWVNLPYVTHWAAAGDPITTTPQATRPDGTVLREGDLYTDLQDESLWYYDGTTWKGASQFYCSFLDVSDPTVATLVRPVGPGNYKVGDLIINQNTGTMFWYDGTSWNRFSKNTNSIIGTGDPITAGVTTRLDNNALEDGDQYVDTATGFVYYYDLTGGTGWNSIGASRTHYVAAGDPNTVAQVAGTTYYDVRPDGTALQAGDLYVDSSNSNLLYYWDGARPDGSKWAIVSQDTHSFFGAGSPGLMNRTDGTPLQTGDQYLDTNNNLLYVYNGGWVIGSTNTNSLSDAGTPVATNTTTRPDGTELQAGDLYVDTSTYLLYMHNGTTTAPITNGWTLISNDTHAFQGAVDPTAVGSNVDAGNRPDGTLLQFGDLYANRVTKELFLWSGSWDGIANDSQVLTGNGVPSVGAPATRLDGGALKTGDLYIDTSRDAAYYWDGVGWGFLGTDQHSMAYSSVATGGSKPTARDNGGTLVSGDQLVDTDTDTLYYYDTGVGGWVEIENTNSIYGTASPDGVIAQRPNTQPLKQGDLFVDGLRNELWYFQGGASTWRRLAHDSEIQTAAGNPTALTTRSDGGDLVNGDSFVDTSTGDLWVWNGSWVIAASGSDVYVQATAPVARADGGALRTGDLHVDTDDDKLYYYDSGAWTAVAGSDDTHSFTGVTAPALTTRPGGSALKDGDRYTNTALNDFYYWNLTNTLWVLIGPQEHQSTSLINKPTTRTNNTDAPLEGDLWTDTDINRTYYWDGTAWKPNGTHNFVSSTTPPAASSEVGDTWVDTDDMTYHVYYDDGSGTPVWTQIV